MNACLAKKISSLQGVVLGAVLLMTGCGVLAPSDSPVVRDDDRDYGPAQPMDMSHVPDAVPRVEARTIAGNKNPYTVLGKTYHLMSDETSYRERGEASWYGKKFHGRRTSNGEVYDMYAMTAAHKTLPIPSYVRVTHVNNGRSVVVRVNDRGPFHGNRIIDLSYAAAQRLGFAEQGVALVDVEIIVPDGTAPPPLRAADASGEQQLPGNTYLQVGAFSAEASARALADRVARETGQAVMISRLDANNPVYRVRVGPLVDTGQLHHAREQLSALGLSEAHVVYE